MLISIHFTELSETLKYNIIKSMLISFNKFSYFLNINNIKNYKNICNYSEIYNRFNKKSCIVYLYYEDIILQGVAITWAYNNYIYLDKFFSLNLKRGIGTKLLKLVVDKYETNERKINQKILWRTNISTSIFYLKHPKVITHFINKRNDIIYMGINRIIWEYEDIYNIKIKSCFK